jgi:hypothetical protein
MNSIKQVRDKPITGVPNKISEHNVRDFQLIKVREIKMIRPRTIYAGRREVPPRVLRVFTTMYRAARSAAGIFETLRIVYGNPMIFEEKSINPVLGISDMHDFAKEFQINQPSDKIL